MEVVQYKEFEIEAAPYRVATTKKWAITVKIWKYKGKESVVRNFSASSAFGSKKDAIKQSIIFGKKIIDGLIRNMSVANM